MTPTTSTDRTEALRRALSRDMGRAVTALTGWPRPDPTQRLAIAEHVGWMMKGVVRQQGSLSSAATRVIDLAQQYAVDAGVGDALAAALGDAEVALASTGFDQSLPVPAQWVTDGAARWRGRKYRRQAYRRWYLPGHSALQRDLSARVFVDVAAPVAAVWRVVADPRRTGEWSHECSSVEFIDGATEPGVGVRFRGANRNGRTTWSKVCTIVEFEPERAFGYVTSGGQGDATAWHFKLEPTATGIRLWQAYQIVAMPVWVSLAVAVLMPSHADRSDALRKDMRKLGALVEDTVRGTAPA